MTFHRQLARGQSRAAAILTMKDFAVALRQSGRTSPIVHGVNLTIHAGEALGIVGESGCGKSITWLAALRLIGRGAQLSGQALFGEADLVTMSDRAMADIRGRRIAMIFQDPMSCLNPVQRIGSQICEALTLHRGLRGSAARAEAWRLLDRVGIAGAERRLDQYPHELSGGMNQRVMIATALAGEPDLLIADEPTTALDATIQAQILDLLRDIRRDSGMALVLISHDLGVVAEMCDRIAVMYAGRFVETGPTTNILNAPRHPYTCGLLAAQPELDGPRRRLSPIGGVVPPPGLLPPGCSFAPRCATASDICRAEIPLLSAQNGGGVACWHAGKSVAPLRAMERSA
jgi:peptide/nickel transport system ATP-binding protein